MAQQLTHLDVYMRLWLEEKQCIETSSYQLDELAKWLVGVDYPVSAEAILSYSPVKYMMAKWLKGYGFSQLTISRLMGVTPPTVSQYVHRNVNAQTYKNHYLIQHLNRIQDEFKRKLRIPSYSYEAKD